MKLSNEIIKIAEKLEKEDLTIVAEKIKETNDWEKADNLIVNGQWENLPEGWTKDSLKKFWDSLTGDVSHKITKCIKTMTGTGIDDPAAFCASLAREMEYKPKK